MVGIQSIYADQPAGIQAGPYNVKITLGVIEDDDSDYPRPVATIVMPTTNMMRMVAELQALFENPDFLDEAKKALDDDSRKWFSAKSGRLANAPRATAVRKLIK